MVVACVCTVICVYARVSVVGGVGYEPTIMGVFQLLANTGMMHVCIVYSFVATYLCGH